MLLSDIEFIRKHSAPMETRSTGITKNLDDLKTIKAMIFDVYGTLFISRANDCLSEHKEVLNEISQFAASSPLSIQLLREHIQESHATSQRQGIDYPEVDILSIWNKVLTNANSRALSKNELRRIALAYELKSNPVWPMPHALEVIQHTRKQNIALGIVSNAQFYTPLLFDAFWNQSLQELGFVSEFCFFSFEEKQAKPEQELFSKLCEQLNQYQITPEEAVYIGNDSVKDIAPAHKAGLQTILFAGDKRSLKTNDQCPPSNVITHWNQLVELTLCDPN